MIWRWEFFTPGEVLSPAGLEQWKRGNFLIQPFALDCLQAFRRELRRPFLVNFGRLSLRGYRSPVENNKIGGAHFSRHVQGIAFDVTVEGFTPGEVAERARAFGWGFVLPYEEQNFTHIDLRP